MIRREKFLFQGFKSLPEYWRVYFSLSKIGKEYEILWDDNDVSGKGETLIMSNTEYEWETNLNFLNQIEKGDKILSLGYGIGMIVPEVKKKGGILTVVEKNQEVIDLEKNLDSDLEIIMGDINQMDFKIFGDRKFDLIFSDITEINQRVNDLERLFTEKGKLIYWNHL